MVYKQNYKMVITAVLSLLIGFKPVCYWFIHTWRANCNNCYMD